MRLKARAERRRLRDPLPGRRKECNGGAPGTTIPQLTEPQAISPPRKNVRLGFPSGAEARFLAASSGPAKAPAEPCPNSVGGMAPDSRLALALPLLEHEGLAVSLGGREHRRVTSPGHRARRKRFAMGDTIEVKGFGKLSPANHASAPLLIVFGGKDVGGRTSGDYMWDYMGPIRHKFHIFVANNQFVNGKDAHQELVKALDSNRLKASQQILYLFSGGWNPGIHLLRSEGTTPFSSILLVDIWMGVGEKSGSVSPDFYKALADTDREKLTYIHTRGGASNHTARDYIAKKLGPEKAKLVKYQKGVDHMDTHMSTNSVAVGMLK